MQVFGNQIRWGGFTTLLFAGAVIPMLSPPGRADETAETAEAAAKERSTEFENQVRPLLKQYCNACHSGDVTEADVDLGGFATFADVRRQAKLWGKVRRMLESRQMPPKDEPQPSDADRNVLQSWVNRFLAREAEVTAGDPGPVVIRRLNNEEYNYTVRDLTGIPSLDPTREFPIDGAAGEGFINTGSAQSMSPSFVVKFLDAGKEVANHAVLLPNEIRFSPHTTRRDKTDELLARIQAFYRNFTEDGGGAAVDLQGIKFNTNQGGLLGVEKYLAATLEERDAIQAGKSIPDVSIERSLNARYLEHLWRALAKASEVPHGILIDELRRKWQNGTPADAPKLAADIQQAQKVLWKFNAVGQLTDGGKQKIWMEPVTPIVTRQELRVPLPATTDDAEIVIYLMANDLGDGNEHDFVVWERPRFEFKPDPSDAGQGSGDVHPPILLRDIRGMVQRTRDAIKNEVPRTAKYLEAVAGFRSVDEKQTVGQFATSASLNQAILQRWMDLVAIGHREKREIRGQLTNKMTQAHGYADVNGWGRSETPNMLTNRSTENISFLTLTVPARGVVMHPSPTQDVVAAWRSPLAGQVRIEGLVADADGVCGNGAAWRVELTSEDGANRIAEGVFDNGKRQAFKPDGEYKVRKGDVVSLIVSAREGNHTCDTTHVELKLTEVGGEARTWNLASDVVDKIQDSNPLPDAFGNHETWHFCAIDKKSQEPSKLIDGSALAKWRRAVIDGKPAKEIAVLARSVQNVLVAAPESLGESDRKLRTRLLDWKGPLRWTQATPVISNSSDSKLGLDPEHFGMHPNGTAIESTSLCRQAPQLIEVRLPASLVAGSEFVTSAQLHASGGQEGSVQIQVLMSKPATPLISFQTPFLATKGSNAQRRLEAAMKDFRELFPAALCYARIVPVDEVVTLTLFFREDQHLQRLMLDEAQSKELDRLWDELFFVAQEPIALTVAFEQIFEFATQDRPDLVKQFGPMRKPINDRADRFRSRLVASEPAHVAAVLEFADRAWRRPLTATEQSELRSLYARLRNSEIPHEKSIQLLLARVLTSPAFLYRREHPGEGKIAAPVTSVELASRLSYFLWASMPDSTLRSNADSGKLVSNEVLIQETRRMLKDARVRRLAIQFACQWLHLRDFDQNDDKNEKLYPEFADLRDEMYEETVQFFEDMFRNDGSILDLLNADHTFLNETLAKHYQIGGVVGLEWRRVENIRQHGRGGILGMASLLASQSGASRTSPILRGNWVYETLLGERLPRPPANVPQLPESVPQGLTARELIERHGSSPQCAKCHVKIDPYGFALEQYNAMGRRRDIDVDTNTQLVDGTKIAGLDGLRSYLATHRQKEVVRQFCRKLLGYALGREVQLSDELLLKKMERRLASADYRFSAAVETIVSSDQFRKIRGVDFSIE